MITYMYRMPEQAMNGYENKNKNKGAAPSDDEGWVYPDPAWHAGAGGRVNYGYDVRSRTRTAPPKGGESAPPQGGQMRDVRRQNGGNYVPPGRPARTAAPSGNAAQGMPRGRSQGSVPPGQGSPGRPPQGAPYQNGAPRRPSGTASPRPGIRADAGGKKTSGVHPAAIAVFAAVLLIIFILIILLIPKGKKNVEAASVPTEEPTTPVTVEAEPEDPPEPERPVRTYASRTDDTVKFGDEISCRNGILIDLETNTIIAEKGGDDRIAPASMTKVLTALVAMENCTDPDDTFEMPYEVLAPLFAEGASVAGFDTGEKVTVRDMLYGALLPSGADGTGGLAFYTAGSAEAFADLMNKKCAELGLTGSHFVTSSGLDADGHYSTCHDIAVIFEAAMDNEEVARAMGTPEYTTSKTDKHPDGIELHHTLLYERLEGSEEFDEKIEVIAGKTGYTDHALNCLVTMAEVKSTGKRYVFVCAGGDGKWAPIFDTIHVYRKYLGVHYDAEFVPKSQR